MNFEECLVYELNTITGLEDKIFPLTAKEGVKPPFVVYISSEGVRERTLDGFLNTKEIECEINVIHKSYKGAKDVFSQVLDKVLTFYGRSIGVDGVFIKSLSYEDPEETYEKEIKLNRIAFILNVRI